MSEQEHFPTPPELARAMLESETKTTGDALELFEQTRAAMGLKPDQIEAMCEHRILKELHNNARAVQNGFNAAIEAHLKEES